MSASPAYIDLQVNGYGGVDFQLDAITPEAMRHACERLRADGVAGILATVVTEDLTLMANRLRRLVEFRERDPLVRDVVIGLHIEGPFISPHDGYRGAHPRDAVREADRDNMKRLLDAAGGLTRLVTLAPEMDPGMATTRLVAGQGIRVSAGHTNATMDQLHAAIDAGLSMFTHLGNGCPMLMHRHDNIIQRALSLSDRIWPMFIADGAHVTFPALRNYLKASDPARTIVVTDAVTPAGQGPGRFKFGRWDIVIGDDLTIRAPDGSHLIGSAMTMPQAVHRLVQHVGLTSEQATQLTATNPRNAIGFVDAAGNGRDHANGEPVAGARRGGRGVQVSVAPSANTPRPELGVSGSASPA
jgi:N-acetylglucosamine-6-phosphate deacetylase